MKVFALDLVWVYFTAFKNNFNHFEFRQYHFVIRRKSEISDSESLTPNVSDLKNVWSVQNELKLPKVSQIFDLSIKIYFSCAYSRFNLQKYGVHISMILKVKCKKIF